LICRSGGRGNAGSQPTAATAAATEIQRSCQCQCCGMGAELTHAVEVEAARLRSRSRRHRAGRRLRLRLRLHCRGRRQEESGPCARRLALGGKEAARRSAAAARRRWRQGGRCVRGRGCEGAELVRHARVGDLAQRVGLGQRLGDLLHLGRRAGPFQNQVCCAPPAVVESETHECRHHGVSDRTGVRA
jgi:hypothetical protein